jgi:imidazolonepropionase-like amidohydrolase
MRLLLQTGLTQIEAIQAGTKYAVFVCGHSEELGTLQPGKFTDIIVMKGNPLVDVGSMDQVIVIIKGGQIVFAQE